MKKQAIVGGLALLSILTLVGCGRVVMYQPTNNTTNATNTTNNSSTNTSNQSTNHTVTNASAGNGTSTNETNTSSNSSVGMNTANQVTNTTTATNSGNDTTGNTTAVNSTSSSNSSVGNVTVQTIGSPNQAAMASAIQSLLDNSAPSPEDCSAMVQYVYKQAGMTVPRMVSQQATAGTRVSSPSQLQYGDIVFFDLSTQPNTPTFDAIYVGNGQFVGDTTHGVMSVQLNDSYWKSKFLYGEHIQ